MSCYALSRGIREDPSTWLLCCMLGSQKPSTTAKSNLHPRAAHNLAADASGKDIPCLVGCHFSTKCHYHVRQTLPVYRLPRVKYLPPVRLKEFPKAENEFRGVKSGLLGLLIGLHKPELMV